MLLKSSIGFMIFYTGLDKYIENRMSKKQIVFDAYTNLLDATDTHKTYILLFGYFKHKANNLHLTLHLKCSINIDEITTFLQLI